MGKYSVYAVQLDHAFKEARTKWTEAYNRLKAAEEDRRRCDEDDKLLAEHNLNKARAAFDLIDNSVWTDFDRQMKEIGEALKSTLAKTNMADPEEVDPNGLTILQSGILSVDELEVFYGRYSGNFTMQRLVAQHVGQLADGEKDPEKRKRLIMLARAAEAGPAGVLDTWKNLEDTARICSGQSHGKGAPSYVLSISSQWEQLTENAIKNF